MRGERRLGEGDGALDRCLRYEVVGRYEEEEEGVVGSGVFLAVVGVRGSRDPRRRGFRFSLLLLLELEC